MMIIYLNTTFLLASQTHLPHTSVPIEDRARELVRKYGDRPAAAQPWKGGGDDDDMSEWDPYSQGNLQQAPIFGNHILPLSAAAAADALPFHASVSHDTGIATRRRIARSPTTRRRWRAGAATNLFLNFNQRG